MRTGHGDSDAFLQAKRAILKRLLIFDEQEAQRSKKEKRREKKDKKAWAWAACRCKQLQSMFSTDCALNLGVFCEV